MGNDLIIAQCFLVTVHAENHSKATCAWYAWVGFLRTMRWKLANEIFGVTRDWSSSPNANNSNNAWGVNFNNGNDNNNNRNNNNHARLVRGGA
jgi:hypothetical protein